MKKNVIALLLSVAVTAGSIMPAAAAETVPVMQEQEEAALQEEAVPDVQTEEADGIEDCTQDETPALTEGADAEAAIEPSVQEIEPAPEEDKEEDNTEEAPVPAVSAEEDAEAVDTIEKTEEETAPSEEDAVLPEAA